MSSGKWRPFCLGLNMLTEPLLEFNDDKAKLRHRWATLVETLTTVCITMVYPQSVGAKDVCWGVPVGWTAYHILGKKGVSLRCG